ncbi:MAG: DUF4258 domain-containing protein [Candidatus Aenigmarchaeota archaeon]|nr:DUF4258 domain-containing protein [Candidatus Aenigmarchaeota archaeon]MDI6722993.1 DUF4258 domain-containing protein [Candidatus Aenigmarchaeota archaeon]
MKIEILEHAKERMKVYDIEEELVLKTVENPDNVAESYNNRKIAQRKLNGYVIRVIYEEKNSTKIIITVYKAKSGRYEI